MISKAKQTTKDADLFSSIEREFPVPSQTSEYDKLALLKVRDIFRSWPSYNYLEIGSFLGGSLVPFCREEHCHSILSIDDRGRHQPDERGATYDYTNITSRMMIENLTKQGISEERVEVFDGSISDIIDRGKRYELMMIDGEHTTWACFRDFIFGKKLLADDAIIMFHDSSLIFSALKIIREYLRATDSHFLFFKDRRSDISFVLMNKFADTEMEKLFDIELDINEFERRAEKRLVRQFVGNRTWLPSPLVKLLVRRKSKQT